MFSLSVTRPATRLWLLVPLFALSSCGGNNTGAVITVPNSVVVADLKNAGVLDIVVASAQIDETGLTQPPGLLDVILNSSATPGVFAAGVTYQSSGSPPSGLAVGDLTGNGSKDMVVANITAGTLSVFMETSPTSGAYSAATTVKVGGEPNDVQIADLNGDGLPDLIVADNKGNVTYLLQNPASPGTFQAPVSLPITNPSITAEGSGFNPRGIAVAVGDLNGDGLPDLAVTSFDINGNLGQVTVFDQDPANPGTFLATPVVYTTYCEPTQIRITDINKDGANDMIVACQGQGTFADPGALADGNPLGQIAFAESLYGAMVILQDPTTPGSFPAPTIYPTVSGSLSLAVADLNMDGWPDIAMTSLQTEGEGTISTLMQDPTNPGTFINLLTYVGDGQPSSIVIGDVNNDGLPDLITADSTSAVWYTNSSSAPGTFGSEGQVGFTNPN